MDVKSSSIKFSPCATAVALFVFGFHCFTALAQTSDAQLPADVRVVIDVSGSMKQNDPNNLRQPALELLVKLLPEGSKAGVWTFGRYVNMLVPHREVNDAWSRTANDKAADINSTGLYTNIGEALEKAAYDLDRGNPGYRTSLILLTDGMVDISREPEENQAEWRRIVDEVLPKFKQAGYTIHTIALSDNADSELLTKLALSTDGTASIAQSAEELMKIFLAAFDTAAPAEQLPLTNNTFAVDSSVEEFTALIFRKADGTNADTQLIGPEQKVYRFSQESPYVNWYRSDRYDLITVSKPIEGEWQINADVDPDSRVTIVSNLNLVVKPIKNNLFINESATLSLLLREDGNTITRADFLDLLDISYRIERRDDGKQWQGSLSDGVAPNDGIYQTTLDMFDTEGYYDLSVVVDGKSFKREFSHTVSVRQPFGVSVEKKIEGASTHHLITVSSYGQNIDVQQTNVVARVKDPRGRSSIKPLELTDVDNWLLELVPDVEGEYDIALRVDAVDKQGGKFEFSPEPLLIHYPDSDDPFANREPVIEVPQVQVPDIVLEPEEEEEQQEQPVAVEEEPPPPAVVDAPELPSEEDNKLWLYIGLGVGNLFILVLAFFAYRMIMGNKEESDLEELEKAVEEAKSATEAKSIGEEQQAPPNMAHMDAGDNDDSDGGDGKLADTLMADDLNIAADAEEEKPAEPREPPPPLDPGETPSEDEDLGVTDVEFSLDDFSADDLDDDD